MPDTHRLQPLAPKAIRYIKLGHGGHAAQDCFDKSEIGLGFDDVPHELCLAGRWDEVAALFRTEGKTTGVASNHTREVRDFYEQGPDTLWITIHDGLLWWAFAHGHVRWEERLRKRLPRRRITIAPWRCTDASGAPLAIQGLSTRLTSVSRYQGTICAVEDGAAYLLRKLNAEPDPLVAKAEALRAELIETAGALIAMLHHHDFEILVDLLFTGSGWRRRSVLGGSEADIDLLVEQVITGERAFVQVKSRASAQVLDDYAKRFRAYPGVGRMFFVCHSPARSLLERSASPPDGVDLWFADELATKAVQAGLFDWLVERVR